MDEELRQDYGWKNWAKRGNCCWMEWVGGCAQGWFGRLFVCRGCVCGKEKTGEGDGGGGRGEGRVC